MAIFFKRNESSEAIDYHYVITKRIYFLVLIVTIILGTLYFFSPSLSDDKERIELLRQPFMIWMLFLGISYFVAQTEFMIAIFRLSRKHQVSGGVISVGYGSKTLLNVQGPLAYNTASMNWILFPETTVRWNKK